MVQKHFVIMALASTLAVSLAAAQGHQPMHPQKDLTFNGTVESVNLKDNTFIVRNDEKGKVEEMEFHVAKGTTEVMIDAQPVLLSELLKGSPVTVIYQTEDTMHMVKSVQSHKKAT